MTERPTDEDASDCVGEALDRALDLTARFLSDRAELGASAAFVMNRVCREGPIRLTTLAAREGVSQPSMTQLIQRLERQGLVTRLADPEDGRAALIGISECGQRLVDDRKRLRRERLTALLATLTSDEECSLRLSARVASPILSRLIANADSTPDSGGHPAAAETVETRPADHGKAFE